METAHSVEVQVKIKKRSAYQKDPLVVVNHGLKIEKIQYPIPKQARRQRFQITKI